MNRFEIWESTYKEYVEEAKRILALDSETGHLCRWIFNTKDNPYSFMGENASMIDTPNGFVGLCNTIHHALVDDGDITFFVLDGEPQFAFIDRHEPDFVDKVTPSFIKDMHVRLEQLMGKTYIPKLIVLQDAFEFTKLRDEYRKKDIKRCFLGDAKRFGVQFAVEHYNVERYSDVFNPMWIVECEEVT